MFKQSLKKYNKDEAYKIKFGKKIAFVEKNELLNTEDIYCKKDVKPNLECSVFNPIIILFSFKLLIYGRWYNPASGLLEVSKIPVIKARNVTIKKYLRSFRILLKLWKNSSTPNIKIVLAMIWLIGKKKFNIKAKDPRKKQPKIISRLNDEQSILKSLLKIFP